MLTPWGTWAHVLRKEGQGFESGVQDSARTLPLTFHVVQGRACGIALSQETNMLMCQLGWVQVSSEAPLSWDLNCHFSSIGSLSKKGLIFLETIRNFFPFPRWHALCEQTRCLEWVCFSGIAVAIRPRGPTALWAWLVPTERAKRPCSAWSWDWKQPTAVPFKLAWG